MCQPTINEYDDDDDNIESVPVTKTKTQSQHFSSTRLIYTKTKIKTATKNTATDFVKRPCSSFPPFTRRCIIVSFT